MGSVGLVVQSLWPRLRVRLRRSMNPLSTQFWPPPAVGVNHRGRQAGQQLLHSRVVVAFRRRSASKGP